MDKHLPEREYLPEFVQPEWVEMRQQLVKDNVLRQCLCRIFEREARRSRSFLSDLAPLCGPCFHPGVECAYVEEDLCV